MNYQPYQPYQPKTTMRRLSFAGDKLVLDHEIEEGVIEGYRFLVRAPLTVTTLESVQIDINGLTTRYAYWNPIFSLPERMPVADLEKLYVEYWREPQVCVAGEGFKSTTSMCMDGIAGVEQQKVQEMCAAHSYRQHRVAEIEKTEKWSDGPIVWEDRETLQAAKDGDLLALEKLNAASKTPHRQARKVMEEVEQLVIGQDSQYTFGGIVLHPEITKEKLDQMSKITTPQEWPSSDLVEGAVYAGDTAFLPGEDPRGMTEAEKAAVASRIRTLQAELRETGDEECDTPIVVTGVE